MNIEQHTMILNRIMARYEGLCTLVECLREDEDVVLVNLEHDIEEHYGDYVDPTTIMQSIESMGLWYF